MAGKLTEVVKVATLFPKDQKYAPAGHYRVRGPTPNGGHPADGMTIDVSFGEGAFGSIINPVADPHPEWVSRYGNVESIRYALAGYLETYDYLLSEAISATEAIRRLHLMRSVRRALSEREGQE